MSWKNLRQAYAHIIQCPYNMKEVDEYYATIKVEFEKQIRVILEFKAFYSDKPIHKKVLKLFKNETQAYKETEKYVVGLLCEKLSDHDEFLKQDEQVRNLIKRHKLSLGIGEKAKDLNTYLGTSDWRSLQKIRQEMFEKDFPNEKRVCKVVLTFGKNEDLWTSMTVEFPGENIEVAGEDFINIFPGIGFTHNCQSIYELFEYGSTVLRKHLNNNTN